MITEEERLRIIHAAKNQLPYEVTSYTLPMETEIYLEEILTLFLEELGQLELKDHLVYCLRELTVNAKKANTKRAYFKELGLDINDAVQYEKGMKTFKEDTLSKIDHYLQLQEKMGLYIKVTFQVKDRVLYLKVRNNVPINHRELTRVYDRIARSRVFNSMEDAFREVLDDSEGAGLGIVIMILMLRKMGLGETAYDLDSVGNETVATLAIPISKVKLEKINLVAEEVVKVIDSLPPFPENIRRVQKMLEDENVDLNKVAKNMSMDPGLAADLLKFVNSAHTGMRRKISSLEEAVRIIGIRGLQTMLYPYGAQKVLSKLLKDQEEITKEAYKVSFYASELARQLKLSRDIQSNAQIGGLMHNLGRAVITLVHPEVHKKIARFCKERNISTDVFEDLTSGATQSEIGARIAEKWNFPEFLVEVIRYQSHPHHSQKQYQALVALIYLAVNILYVEKGYQSYMQISKPILRAFKIESEEAVAGIHASIKKSWEEASKLSL